jgi:TATA-box binding protein (TBP) (component of TFIID and TFIIIB)
MSLNEIDNEWEMFLSNQITDNDTEDNCFENQKHSHLKNNSVERDLSIEIPKATDIYISTKSKIAYLNHPMNLNTIFWGIKIKPYSRPEEGIIKKQMKFNSMTPEELNIIQENLKNEVYYEQQIITSIHNPSGRIKFKDIRKISVGISKKDIMSYRIKKKSAFYNCFVMIMRIKVNDTFKEFHIKIFNTGKVEIPGVQNDDNYNTILLNIVKVLQPFIKTEILDYNQKSITVLINSNFNCGFYINRERLHEIFKYKYNIQSIYDPCSYPGIQSKFYYHTQLEKQTGIKMLDDKKQIEVSFMVFRTGSILIVGMCDEKVLYDIYEFLKNLLITEFHEINQKVIKEEVKVFKDKKKLRKKTLTIQI